MDTKTSALQQQQNVRGNCWVISLTSHCELCNKANKWPGTDYTTALKRYCYVIFTKTSVINEAQGQFYKLWSAGCCSQPGPLHVLCISIFSWGHDVFVFFFFEKLLFSVVNCWLKTCWGLFTNKTLAFNHIPVSWTPSGHRRRRRRTTPQGTDCDSLLTPGRDQRNNSWSK